jgi:MFS family permease
MNMNPDLKSEKLWSKNFLLLLLSNAFISMNFFMLNPTFPVYIKTIDNNLGAVGILTALFTLTAMLVRPFSGMAVDRFDKKRIYFIGVLLLCVSFIGYIIFKPIPGIVFARLIHGVGWGLTTTAISTLASDIIPLPRMGEGIGYFTASSVVAMSIGPILGLEILNGLGAGVLFGVTAGFTFFSGIILFAYKDATDCSSVEIVPDRTNRNGTNRNGFSDLFERTAILPAGVGFFLSIVSSALMTYISLYAAQRGILNIGYFFTIQSAVVLFSRPIAGILVDRKGFGIAVVPALVCTAISMVILYMAANPVIFVITAIIYGLGFGTALSSLQAMSVVRADRDRRGAANSTYLTGMDMGFGLGSVLAGFIASAAGYGTMYLLCIIPLLAGLGVFIFGGGMKIRNASREKVRIRQYEASEINS